MSETSRFRTPTEPELAVVLRMLTRAYVADRGDFPDDPSVLAAYGEHDPVGTLDDWVVLWERDVPLSALRLFRRHVTHENGTVPIGGIGNVGTDPAAAGRGLASHVVREAHRRLVADGTTTAVLVTDIPAFYARLGYEPVGQKELVGSGARLPSTTHQPRPIPRDVPRAVREIHAAAAARTGGRVRRDARYWTRWIMDFHVTRDELDALELPGAYMIGRVEEAGASYRVLEGGGDPVALGELVAHAARGAGRVKTPDEPVHRRVLDAFAASVSVRVRTGIMAIALTPGALGAEELASFLELDTF